MTTSLKSAGRITGQCFNRPRRRARPKCQNACQHPECLLRRAVTGRSGRVVARKDRDSGSSRLRQGPITLDHITLVSAANATFLKRGIVLAPAGS
jgi:hypothetical protein